MSGARSTRIIRGDKRLKSRDLHTNSGAGGGDCPTITLGDLSQTTTLVGVEDNIYGIISGGTAPYITTVDSGTIPTGYTLSTDEISPGVFAFFFEGQATTFGIFTFTIGGTDDNGCPITPREYTIEVWAEFTNSTPTPAGGSHFITVSGLPANYGVGVVLQSILFDATIADLALYYMYVFGPLAAGEWDGYDHNLIGFGVTNALFSRDGVANISTGSSPYTGTWNDISTTTATFDDAFGSFGGIEVNGDWDVQASGDVGDTVNSVTLVFKPIP